MLEHVLKLFKSIIVFHKTHEWYYMHSSMHKILTYETLIIKYFALISIQDMSEKDAVPRKDINSIKNLKRHQNK